MEIFKFLLKFVPSTFLAKLQNLPTWAYVVIVAINGGLAALYNHFLGSGAGSNAAIVEYIMIGIATLFGAKATLKVAADEFDVPNGK